MIIKIRKPQSFSEIGRKENQEDFLWPLPNEVTNENRIFLMCDGVGGQDNGEIASETAATAIGTYLSTHLSDDGTVTKGMFENALAYGYDALDRIDNGSSKKMGTTMTCLVLHSGGALVAHIGDSRVYHIRPSLSDSNGRTGIIYQSADHSLVNDLLRAGELTEDEAANYPHKNVITRAMQPHLERRCKADIYNLDDVKPGDYFFLCCDGVLEQLTNDMLGQILADENLSDADKIKMIKNICDGKTRDNYTCWLIPIDEVEGAATEKSEEDEVVATVVVENSEENELNSTGENDEIQECETEENNSFWSKIGSMFSLFFAIASVALLLIVCSMGFLLGDKSSKFEKKEKNIVLDSLAIAESIAVQTIEDTVSPKTCLLSAEEDSVSKLEPDSVTLDIVDKNYDSVPTK